MSQISTQADGAQSSRVPVPLPEDPYEAIRQAYIVKTDDESEPVEDLVETEAPESPHTIASPTLLPDSTPPAYHAEESEDSDTSGERSATARMAVRVPTMMSPGRSACIAEVAAMSNSAFRTSELVGDEEEEDEEVEESPNSNSESEDVEDEAPATGDEGLAAGMKVLAKRVESLGLGGDETVPEGQQQAAPVVETVVGEPLGSGYGALRHRELASREGQRPSVFEVDLEDGKTYIDVPAYPPPAPPVQTPPSPEWSSGSLPISLAPSTVPSPISSPMISLNIPSPVASPATAEAKGFLAKLGA
ncbi:hypothetical protein Tco_0885654 [Tanacetum coccineum]